jgi:hypothetical protein
MNVIKELKIVAVIVVVVTAAVIGALFLDSSPRSIKLDAPVAEVIERNAAALRKLSAEDKKLLAGFILRQAFNPDIPADNIGEAIDNQKEFAAASIKRREQEAEEEMVIEQRREEKHQSHSKGIKIEVVDKYMHEGEYKTTTALKVKFTNTSGKDIRAVEYDLIIRDLFGDVVRTLNVKAPTRVPTGKALLSSYHYRYNQYIDEDMALANMKLENMKISWRIASIIYDDK